MRDTIGFIISVISGCLIGFFGVLVSVFSDSGLKERLITVAVILLVYFILGLIFGVLWPKYSWRWGIMLGAPGAILLMIYMIKEYHASYIIYLVLILLISFLSARLGSMIRNRR